MQKHKVSAQNKGKTASPVARLERPRRSVAPRSSADPRDFGDGRAQARRTGRGEAKTGVPFLDHMLESFARHGFFDLKVEASGDLHIDDHHTVEDVGMVVGRAFRQALGDRTGIKRFGEATVPLDEAVCTAMSISAGVRTSATTSRSARSGSATSDELVHDFMKALTDEVGMNLHLTW